MIVYPGDCKSYTGAKQNMHWFWISPSFFQSMDRVKLKPKEIFKILDCLAKRDFQRSS